MGLLQIKLGDFIANITDALNRNFSNILSKDNTLPFTPTDDYNPATKKYVDDSVAEAGGGDMLKSVYDTNTNGIVDNAEKVNNALSIKYGESVLATFNGSAPTAVDVIPSSAKGAADGVASLDASGKVPSAQLPSFVDDVVEGWLYNGQFWEESSHTTVIPPESGKIYVDLHTNTSWRWTGTQFTEISQSAAVTGADVQLTGYVKPATSSPVETTDNVNQAIGKLERAVEEIVPYAPTKTTFDATTNWSATATDGIYTLTQTIAAGKIPTAVYRLNGADVYDLVLVGVSVTGGTTLKILSHDKFAGYVILV